MPQVTNTSTGQSAQCQDGASLQEVAEQNDMGIPFGCASGICCTCLITIGKGAENLSPIEDIEEMTLDARGADENQRLACQCQILGDLEFSQDW